MLNAGVQMLKVWYFMMSDCEGEGGRGIFIKVGQCYERLEPHGIERVVSRCARLSKNGYM
jgi:hypothetical protein